MKCEVCKQQVAVTFLGKPIGTYMKDEKGKKHIVCSECQRIQSKEEILAKL